jgi:hypothetical protein
MSGPGREYRCAWPGCEKTLRSEGKLYRVEQGERFYATALCREHFDRTDYVVLDGVLKIQTSDEG